MVHWALTQALGSPKRAVHSLLLVQASRVSVLTITLQPEAASRLAPNASNQEARRTAAARVWPAEETLSALVLKTQPSC